MIIEKATLEDSIVLTAITKRSKAYWGYSEEQMLAWSDALTIHQNYIGQNSVFKLVADGKIIGYYSYFNVNDTSLRLDNLFILPEFIGKGLGKLLMQHFLNRIKQSTVKTITLEADPNAEPFYKKLGFITIGKLETTQKDRFLPIMELSME